MHDPAQQRNEVLKRLELAVMHLNNSMSPLLVPEQGASIGYAIPGARDSNGIAAVPGKIIVRDGRVSAGGPCAFGADDACARIILTVMKCDPLIRSVATIRFSGNVLAVFEAMLLECVPLDRTKKAPGISTMDWGIASSCNDGVPDVIYDDGGDQRPGIIHVFGEDPLVVTNNIIICSNRI
ncbi:MAG: phosphomethylpyrimidine kinase [Methanomicrobiales archaeon HGW-Methanomicrobiales-1]|jgi:hydroxymethylpyrimidine/phosphomethylpyrimidine kinase|nr:MAG: phosphomethylpyrimidine kinase [Methanomicrobiales archaeon HGW-Methanomicrobiales-1]